METMKRSKRRLAISLLTIIAMVFTLIPMIPGAAAKASAAELLPAPTITIDANGVATWIAVEGAVEYSVNIASYNQMIGANQERSFDIKGCLDTDGSEPGVYTLTVCAVDGNGDTISQTAKATYAYGVEVIDELHIDYTTENAVAGVLAYELTKELRSLDGKNISNGTEDVGRCMNVYLFSYTEPNRQGTRTQIDSSVTDLIDPNLYYYANFEISAKNSGFDFKHDGTTFDTSSVKTIINGVETAVQWSDNYNEYWKCAEFYIPIKISKIAIDDYTATLSATSYTYDGTAKTPEVTVDGLTKDVDYKVTYSNNTNAGTGKVIVEGIGNYDGMITKNFTIAKQSSSKCKASLSTINYTYNGKAKTPSVTVKNAAGATLKNGTDYTVSYASGRKNVGSYKVTVTFKGDNYIGSKFAYFNINPKGTSISKLYRAKKAFTVKWKKQSAKMATSTINGYQIRYSTSSKMTNAKYKTVKGYKYTSKKITKLKAKKKYYVQVRTYKTVSGKNYYSSWSSIKSVKTK